MDLRKNQDGIVSLIVSITIMIIISLVVISFARLMRTEQEQALDRQLSSQAFYAAETAVNDVACAAVANVVLSVSRPFVRLCGVAYHWGVINRLLEVFQHRHAVSLVIIDHVSPGDVRDRLPRVVIRRITAPADAIQDLSLIHI